MRCSVRSVGGKAGHQIQILAEWDGEGEAGVGGRGEPADGDSWEVETVGGERKGEGHKKGLGEEEGVGSHGRARKVREFLFLSRGSSDLLLPFLPTRGVLPKRLLPLGYC